jgi:ferric-dicitrate binding protein FerR (iron transport regulator)
MFRSINGKRMSGLALLFLAAVSQAVLSQQQRPYRMNDREGQVISAEGTVTVNGASAISGATVFSDSTVTTAKGSSAVVSLGKLGRVELQSETSIKLTYADSSITVNTLTAGASTEAAATQGRSLFVLSTNPGVAGTVITGDGQVLTDSTKRTEFTVDMSCGDTLVSVKKGSVTLRAGDSVKQIAAGSQDTAGQARPGCIRSR